MIATLPLRPPAPLTPGLMAHTRRETAMTRPDHTPQLMALLECLKDICVEMGAASWEDIPEHPSTDRTRGFLLSTARLVESFPDQPRRGHYLAREVDLVKAAHTAGRVLTDPIPEVAPVLDRIRETLEEMGEVVR